MSTFICLNIIKFLLLKCKLLLIMFFMNGKYLKQLRKEKNLTQTELAALLGYSGKSTISKIEKDEFELSQEKLKKYAEIFNVSVIDIMGFEHDSSFERAELADIFDSLSEDNQAALLDYAKLLKLKEEKKEA